MGLKFIQKENFYSNLFEKNSISNKITSIHTSFNNALVYKNVKKLSNNTQSVVFNLVPSYLHINIDNQLMRQKVFHKHGYAINLDGITSVDSYIKSNCSTNFKKNVARSLNRLESCFNIKYNMFYGNIQKEDYDLLMQCLHEMIMKRFQQRTGRNKVLTNWQDYTSKTYSLINNKQASLFVIYNENEPIEISLNFHFNNILYSSISSYALDYSKFSLGNIEIYKQLEWCLANNVMLFDMGYGDLDYKKSWCNLMYNFESHVIASNNKPVAKMYAFFLKLKYRLINFLIAKKLNDSYYNLKGYFKKETPKNTSNIPEYKTEHIDGAAIETQDKQDITQELNTNFRFLKKPIYDFLYTNNEHIKNISVYKLNKPDKTYIATGSKNHLKITASQNELN
ncbi:hypothetical protein CJ739_3380 [Mariniflexile rhizosphaerae]|nr:hypothetical protein CJ739_3380 [Mariniflexile sp. TRM1-10]PLB18382.1 MAG: hypothetical protein TRG1_2771 [Flavobacteriaceae bacterium FS1-H7996/R]